MHMQENKETLESKAKTCCFVSHMMLLTFLLVLQDLVIDILNEVYTEQREQE